MREKLAWVMFLTAVVAHPAETQVADVARTDVPSPQTAIAEACEAAGGMAAFRGLGILEIDLERSEVTSEGEQSETSIRLFTAPPGPIPGRLEIPKAGVVAGDDDTGGWVVVGGEMDARPAVHFMVRRLLQTDLFPALLPFSLTWEGVTVSEVAPGSLGDKGVWALKVTVPTSFFHTPQISSTWYVLLDRTTFEVVMAESEYVDLGRGVVADGMRFRFANKVTLGGVALWSQHSIVGLDQLRREKPHSRLDELSFHTVDTSRRAALFTNPIPPDQRPVPRPNVGMPPQGAPPSRPPGD